MVITSGVTAQQMGKTLAEALHGQPRIAEIWVTTRPDGVHIWLIVEPIETEEQRRLYLFADVLHELFPGSPAMLHILNPRNHRGDIHLSLPGDATPVVRESQ